MTTSLSPSTSLGAAETLASQYGQCFGAFDLRAIVNERFDATAFYGLGKAWAQLAVAEGQTADKPLVVGHDARLTRKELTEALIQGLLEGGFKVVNIGLCPTPLVSFVEIASRKGITQAMHGLSEAFTQPMAGALMVTASHNPSPYNGLKFTLNALPPSRELIAKFKALYLALRAEPSFAYTPKALEGNPAYAVTDAYPLYISEAKKEFAGVAKGLRLAVDGANGSGGPLLVELLEALEADEVVALFTEPDGRFPNHAPDPSARKNLVQLCEKVVETKVAFGFALDGDADRLATVDEQGEPISNDVLLALYAKHMNPDKLVNGLTRNVICEIKSPAALMLGLEAMGFIPQLSKTGHVFMKESMKHYNSPVGGEYSGHFFFRDEHPGYDDPLYAACRLLRLWQEEAKRQGKAPAELTLSGLVKGLLPASVISDELRLPCPKEKAPQVVETLQQDLEAKRLTLPMAVKTIHRLDGIRVDLEGGFILVRPSNTEPLVSARFEAPNAESFAALKTALYTWLNANGLNPDALAAGH